MGESPILRLAPVMSSDGVLLVGGRLGNAPVREDSRHQMILPKGHPVVDLIVRECHEESGHMGSEYILAETRRRYWIVGGRVTVRSVLRGCFKCRRREATRCEQ